MSTNDSPPGVHQIQRRAIGRHFAGRVSVSEESAMRAHLAACPACTAFYERQLLFARLDPAGLPAERRIARGLGLPKRPRPGWAARLVAAAVVPVAAAAVAVVWLHGRPNGEETVGDAVPASRGGAAAAPAFWAYRLDRGTGPHLATAAIMSHDELAFAYANPGALEYLLIFGRDEHRHVYWFHPGWAKGQPAPIAIRATSGPGPHELPDAIGHPYDGRRLDLFAVFAATPIAVTTVEGVARDAADAGELSARLATRSVIVQHRVLEVKP